MKAGELIGIIMGVCVAFGGFIVWFTGWVKSVIRAEIERYDNHVKDEIIKELKEDNRRLNDWAKKSK